MAQAPFTLDFQLENDTHDVGRLALCRVLLMDDVQFPWLILVPERAGIVEILDLAADDRRQLWTEIEQASAAVQALFGPDKLNVAALGNMVRQLHVHVVARFASDAAWPRPVWGSGSRQPYAPHQAGIAVTRIAKALGIPDT